MGRENVVEGSSELLEIVRQSQESGFLRDQAGVLEEQSNERIKEPDSDDERNQDSCSITDHDDDILVRKMEINRGDKLQSQIHSDIEIHNQKKSPSKVSPSYLRYVETTHQEKDAGPLGSKTLSPSSFQTVPPASGQDDGQQISNATSGVSLDSATWQEIVIHSTSGTDGNDDTTINSNIIPVPPLVLRRQDRVVPEEYRQPGAFLGSPGNEFRRSEKISFALVGATASLNTAEQATIYEDGNGDDDSDIECPSELPTLPRRNRDLDPSQQFSDTPAARLVTGQSHFFLPRAEEETEEDTVSMTQAPPIRTKKSKTTMIVCALCLAPVIGIVIVILSFALSVKEEESPKPSQSTQVNRTDAQVNGTDSELNGTDLQPNISESQLNNTESPYTSMPPSMIDTVMDLLPNDTYSALTRPNSPQAQAYQWILDDPYMATYNSERLLQRFSLATIYFALDGQNWFKSSNWLSYEHHECQWYFRDVTILFQVEPEFSDYHAFPTLQDVTDFPCENDPQQSYSHLWLPNNNLKGQLPPELYLLTSLKSIVLDTNHLGGSNIHNNIGKLTALESLALSSCAIGGAIPTEIGLLTKLSALVLFNNNIESTIPTQVGSLSSLFGLLLDENVLTGTIPPELGELNSLGYLYLAHNDLDGTIPSKMPSSLIELELQDNQLTGPLPSSSTLLEVLLLHDNLLTGTLGSLEQDENLAILQLDVNMLSGSIPPLSTFLFEIFLHDNQLTGQIPSELGLLIDLDTLTLSNNPISGTVPKDLKQKFILLDLADTLLSGTLPKRLCRTGQRFGCPFFPEFKCTLEFDCSEILCGCDCPCIEQQSHGNASSTNMNATR